MFRITFTIGNTKIIFKANTRERAIELVRRYKTRNARAYLGNMPLNLHTIRG